MLEVRQTQAMEEQRVDHVAKEHFGEGVLAVGCGEELLHRFIRECKQLIAREAGLEVFDLLLDPSLVKLSRRC